MYQVVYEGGVLFPNYMAQIVLLSWTKAVWEAQKPGTVSTLATLL